MKNNKEVKETGSTAKNDLTELVFILDRSGSMSGLESDTIGGFNAMIREQKKQDGKVLVTTVLFDSKTEVLHDRFGHIIRRTSLDRCGQYIASPF